jgi:hypothetical protein
MRVHPTLALALLLASATVGQAQAQAQAEDTEAAQRDFEAASRAFDRGEHEEALRLFRSAFDAVPRAAVRFNIAVCLERLGRLREAWLEYRAAIAPGELTPEQLTRAESEAARLRALLATAEVRGSPEGADVRIDGVSVCSLPCTAEIDPGSHTVSAHANGQSAERGIRVDRGQRLSVELEVPRAVDTTPANVLDEEGETATGDGASAVNGARGEDRDEPAGGAGVGWLTGVGVAVAAIGAGGVIGFGLHTQSLHDEWLAGGPDEVRDEGLTMRTITNVSIGVLALGGALVLLDLLLAAGGNGTGERASAQRPGTIYF